MPTSTSRHSYTDCYDLLDRALDDAKGIRIRCKDFGVAKQLQLRCHAARSVDRGENRQTYPEDHALYGRSIYDKLKVSIQNGENVWLQISRVDTIKFDIESLSEGEQNVG